MPFLAIRSQPPINHHVRGLLVVSRGWCFRCTSYVPGRWGQTERLQCRIGSRLLLFDVRLVQMVPFFSLRAAFHDVEMGKV